MVTINGANGSITMVVCCICKGLGSSPSFQPLTIMSASPIYPLFYLFNGFSEGFGCREYKFVVNGVYILFSNCGVYVVLLWCECTPSVVWACVSFAR